MKDRNEIKKVDDKNKISYRIDANSMKWNSKFQMWYFDQMNVRLWDNNVLREQMGANAQKYISEHHDWEKISKKICLSSFFRSSAVE